MGFIEAMKERGLMAQVTHEEELADHLNTPGRTAYAGFDPTAPSLHVGHLMPIMGLRRWQQAGHRAVALVGGGTVLVGDPTGKTEMRPMLAEQMIAENEKGIAAQIAKFVDLDDSKRGLMVNNADWLRKLNYLELLREIGPHFSVNRMLTAECFKARYEKGLSFLEFNYMILQSYDFLHLHRQEQCSVQLGGDDQWSNILGGMELIRRLGDSQAFCFTMPLLTTPDGRKMGKTEKGAVWLDPNLTSPYEYYQYWRNVDDAMVGKCLAYFTELPMAQVNELAEKQGKELNESKKVLAFECTKMLHGEASAQDAEATTAKLFAGGGAAPTGDEPVYQVDKAALGAGRPVIEVLVKAGVFASKGEARRLIQQGGLTVADAKVADPNHTLAPDAFGSEGLLCRKGKKHYFRLVFS